MVCLTLVFTLFLAKLDIYSQHILIWIFTPPTTTPLILNKLGYGRNEIQSESIRSDSSNINNNNDDNEIIINK
jgi:hypothetical protein